MAPRKRHARPSSRSWDPVAAWYTGWVGPNGSDHHRELAIPALLTLLEVRRGERVLDLGCGPGVLAADIAATLAQLAHTTEPEEPATRGPGRPRKTAGGAP